MNDMLIFIILGIFFLLLLLLTVVINIMNTKLLKLWDFHKHRHDKEVPPFPSLECDYGEEE